MQGIRGKGVNFLGLNLLLGSLKLLIYKGFRFIQQALFRYNEGHHKPRFAILGLTFFP